MLFMTVAGRFLIVKHNLSITASRESYYFAAKSSIHKFDLYQSQVSLRSAPLASWLPSIGELSAKLTEGFSPFCLMGNPSAAYGGTSPIEGRQGFSAVCN